MSTYYQETKQANYQKYQEIRKTLPVYAQEFLKAKAVSCQASTLEQYTIDLTIFFTFLCQQNPAAPAEMKDVPLEIIDSMSFHDINEYQAYLKNGYRDDGHMYSSSEYTIARRMSSLRSFFKFLFTHQYIKADPTQGAERVRIKKDKAVDRLKYDQVETLLHTVETTNFREDTRQEKFRKKTKDRDYAIVQLFLTTGLRVSELVGLNIADIDFRNSTLSVIRKGGKRDIVYFNDDVSASLMIYIENERNNYLDETSPDKDALFLSNRGTRMSVSTIQKMLKEFAKEALPGEKRVYPHKLRKTYGTELYDKTGDIRLVADVLGHSSVDTTARHYIDVSDQHKRIARDVDLYKD